MSNYRRAQTPGGSYFFTVVTYRRQALLLFPESRHILRRVIHQVRKKYPFAIDAWVLLPEHMHCIWTLPPGDSDFSKRWGIIKARKGRLNALRRLGVRGRLLKMAYSSRGAWYLARCGTLTTALRNTTLRRYGFLVPSDLAAAH